MTESALAPLETLVGEAVQLAEIIDARGAWREPSACPGWTVQDVYAHLAQMFHSLHAPHELPEDTGVAELNADRAVDALRCLSPDDVIELYRADSAQGMAVLEKIQSHHPDRPFTMAELGRYPRHLLADAFVFDHYCHLVNDVLGAQCVELPADYVPPVISSAVVGWMISGLVPMSGEPLRSALTDTVLLELRGTAGGAWLLRPAGDELGVSVTEASPNFSAAVLVRSTDQEFVRWGTRRTPWRSEAAVSCSGDTALAERVLDAINIV